jgi:glucose dehydrogenase
MTKDVGRNGPAKWLLVILGLVLAAAGLFLGINGARLIAWGGSWYFLLAGAAMVISGVLIALRKPIGAWVYAVMLVLTAVWAVWDAGWHFWPLVSRLVALRQCWGCWWRWPIRRWCAGRAGFRDAAPTPWPACWRWRWSPPAATPSCRRR